MTGRETLPHRRFYRSSERRMVGGVCAGLADYFGFNLKATRILAILSFLVAAPATLLAYIGTVLLVPAAPKAPSAPRHDPGFRKALRSDPGRTMGEVGRRMQKLDARLARLERYVTSPRFDLDQEFRKL